MYLLISFVEKKSEKINEKEHFCIFIQCVPRKWFRLADCLQAEG